MGNPEHEAMPALGVEAWNRSHPDTRDTLEYGEAFDALESNLMRTTMAEMDLTGIDFDIALLSGVNVDGANLRGARRRLAALTEAVLRHADLTRADRSETNLAASTVTEAVLHNARLRRVSLCEATADELAPR